MFLLLVHYDAGPGEGCERRRWTDRRLDQETMIPVSLTFDLPSLTATETLGRHLGNLLFPEAVIGLVGPLGAGKTQLVRAVA